MMGCMMGVKAVQTIKTRYGKVRQVGSQPEEIEPFIAISMDKMVMRPSKR